MLALRYHVIQIQHIFIGVSVFVFPHVTLSIYKQISVFSLVKYNITQVILNSNTPRLYSQWLNSVIYWLINHCTDWARTGVTSFGRQFEFYDVIYHISY